MKSSPGLKTLQVATQTLWADRTLAVQGPVVKEAAEQDAGAVWASTHGRSPPQPLQNSGGTSLTMAPLHDNSVFVRLRTHTQTYALAPCERVTQSSTHPQGRQGKGKPGSKG